MPTRIDSATKVRYRAYFSGRVQGVGFRATTRALASERGLVGWVRNEPDGTVSMEVQGPQAMVDDLLVALEQARPAKTRTIETSALLDPPESAFEIRA